MLPRRREPKDHGRTGLIGALWRAGDRGPVQAGSRLHRSRLATPWRRAVRRNLDPVLVGADLIGPLSTGTVHA